MWAWVGLLMLWELLKCSQAVLEEVIDIQKLNSLFKLGITWGPKVGLQQLVVSWFIFKVKNPPYLSLLCWLVLLNIIKLYTFFLLKSAWGPQAMSLGILTKMHHKPSRAVLSTLRMPQAISSIHQAFSWFSWWLVNQINLQLSLHEVIFPISLHQRMLDKPLSTSWH